MPRTPVASPFGIAATHTRPAGQRVPQIVLVRLGVWCALLLLVALCWMMPGLVAWARSVPATDPFAALAGLIRALAGPEVWPWMWWSTLGALVLVAGELALGAGMMVCQRLASYRVTTTYFRIRTPAPAVRSAALGPASRTSGEAFFRSIQGVIPIAKSVTLRERFFGAAPYVAFTLTGLPDQPIETGLLVADSVLERRRTIGVALRSVIEGQSPGTLVEVADDPIASLPSGAIVVSRELTLKMAALYPIRAPHNADAAALLGPLVSAIAPRGTLRSEIQLIVRPWRSRSLIAGWRAQALATLLGLQGKEQHALAHDARSIEAKLDAIPYTVTIRVLFAVASLAELPQAKRALAQVQSVLGQYAERTGNVVQQFIPAPFGESRTVVPPPPPQRLAEPGRVPVRRRLPLWLHARPMAPIRVLLPLILLALVSASVWAWWLATPLAWAQLVALPLATLLSAEAATRFRQRVRQRWQWLRIRNRSPFFTAAPTTLLIRAWRAPMILSSVELAGLWHLPMPALGAHIRWLSCKHLAAPPHAFIDPSQMGDRIVVGLARRADGTLLPVGPTRRDLRQVMHLTAGMGTGKSRLLANICQQLLPDGLLLMDGKGDDVSGSLVATVRQLIPLDYEDRLVILDVLDAQWPIGFNPFAGIDLHRPGGADLALGQLMAIFARLDPETWGKSQGMQQYAQMACLLVLEGEAATPTLAHVKQALLDASYRATLLPRVRNPEVRSFWVETFPTVSEQQKNSLNALMRRFDNVLASELTRYLITQPTPTFDLGRAMEERMIVLIPMPDMTLGGMAGLIGMLMFQAFVRAAFNRPGSDQSRDTYPLVIDEFQVFIGNGDTTDIETALTRLRSLGIAAIYAHQSLTQLGDLADQMLINAQSRIILQTKEPDASIYARQYAASGLTSADITSQEPLEHQYATLLCERVPAGPFSMLPLPWPAPVAPSPAAYDGPAWQLVLPPGEAVATDRLLLTLVYGRIPDWDVAVAMLATWSEEEWNHLLARWDAIRAIQRAYMLAHPGCVPDRLERQQWLSRLLAATPRILAAASYARLRRQLSPADGAPAAPPASRPKQGRSVAASLGAPAAVIPLSDEERQSRLASAASVAGAETTVPVVAGVGQPRGRTFRSLRAQRVTLGKRRLHQRGNQGFHRMPDADAPGGSGEGDAADAAV